MTTTIETHEFSETAKENMADSQGKNTLHVQDHTGDTRVMWDPRNKDEVVAAKGAFDAAKAKGMVAYAVDPETGGRSGTVIREFDKKQGKIIMTPALQGG